MDKEKIIVEELEEKTEPTVKQDGTAKVQSMNSADIGAILFTGDKLTILPKDFEQKFGVEGKVNSLAGKDIGSFDLSKLAGAFERVTELEKSVADKDEEITKLKADLEKGMKKEDEPEPDAEKPPEEEKKKDEDAEAKKEEEKKSAVAKSVEAESTKEEAEHSATDVDDDIRGLMGGLKKARQEGSL